MVKSDFTKKKQRAALITGIISFIINVGPVIWFVIAGFIKGDTKQKICLSMMSIIAIILACMMLVFKFNLKRSIFFATMIGIYICLDKLAPVIITLAICSILDEIIIAPLHHRFKEDYHTNKQIDKRS